MNKIIKLLAGPLFAAYLFFAALPAFAADLKAPTLISINTQKAYNIYAPVITGLAPENCDVLVFIDNSFAGPAAIKISGKASNSFVFQAHSLKEGEHKAYLVSKDRKSGSESTPSPEFIIKVLPLPAPTLIVPNEDTVTGKVKPLIEGLTKSGTLVHIYLDGKYNGRTDIVENDNGTAYFAYRPFLNLSVGEHRMWALSEDASGRRSAVSKVYRFSIEDRMPAPSLLFGESNGTIYGLAKNDSKVSIYIDNRLDGEFNVKNDASGTANFSYRIKTGALKKQKLIYAIAYDKRGKESIWSNFVNLLPPEKNPGAVDNKPSPKAEISDSAVSEDKAKEDLGEEKTDVANTPEASKSKLGDYLVFAELFKNDPSVRLNQEQYNELDGLLEKKEELGLGGSELESLANLAKSNDIQADDNNATGTKEEINIAGEENGQGGLVNESKEKQSVLGWNAVIFIFFLMAVIAWIFWVNRELIKEKKEAEEKQKENNKGSEEKK